VTLTQAHRVMTPHGGAQVLHLTRDDAEAFVCAIPRPALAASTRGRDLVCPDCVEWLLKRAKVSAAFRMLEGENKEGVMNNQSGR
jgi:hypothetical protein